MVSKRLQQSLRSLTGRSPTGGASAHAVSDAYITDMEQDPEKGTLTVDYELDGIALSGEEVEIEVNVNRDEDGSLLGSAQDTITRYNNTTTGSITVPVTPTDAAAGVILYYTSDDSGVGSVQEDIELESGDSDDGGDGSDDDSSDDDSSDDDPDDGDFLWNTVDHSCSSPDSVTQGDTFEVEVELDGYSPDSETYGVGITLLVDGREVADGEGRVTPNGSSGETFEVEAVEETTYEIDYEVENLGPV